MISEAVLADLKARNPCDQVAARWVKLRKRGRKMMGPCPLHSPDPAARDSTSFECDADGWVCATCSDGGDVIKLIMLRDKIEFPTAVEQLGGIIEPDPVRAAAIEQEQEVKRAKLERDSNVYREKERRTAFEIWHHGKPLPGSWAEDYLHHRGLTALPDRLQLRFAPEIAYFHGEEDDGFGRKVPRVVYRGPAMLGPIVGADGKFRAVHITWIDPVKSGSKAFIHDPDSEDPNAALPAKKVRGSKAGNVIRLVDPLEPKQLYIGEGIETVLSVWLALHQAGRDLAGVAFWSAVDLGNIGGRASESVPHPTLKDVRGRMRNVPGPQPDPTSPAIVIPESVTEIILLGDGDSDRFTAQCALARASARFVRPGREVTVMWADIGMDFNDELRKAA